MPTRRDFLRPRPPARPPPVARGGAVRVLRPPEAQYHPHPGRRPRLQPARLLRRDEDPDAAHRPAGRRGHALHPGLLREPRLRPVAVRPAHGPSHRACSRPRQPGDRAGGPDAPAGRDGDAAPAAPGRGLRDGARRQVGARLPRLGGRAPGPGIRRLLRLQLPAQGPQPLPAGAVARPRAHPARRQRRRPGRPAVRARPLREGGPGLHHGQPQAPLLPLLRHDHPAPRPAGPGGFAGGVRRPLAGNALRRRPGLSAAGQAPGGLRGHGHPVRPQRRPDHGPAPKAGPRRGHARPLRQRQRPDLRRRRLRHGLLRRRRPVPPAQGLRLRRRHPGAAHRPAPGGGPGRPVLLRRRRFPRHAADPSRRGRSAVSRPGGPGRRDPPGALRGRFRPARRGPPLHGIPGLRRAADGPPGELEGRPAGPSQEPCAPIELYDLESDLAETRDVAAGNRRAVAELERFMAGARRPSKEFPFPALDGPASSGSGGT